MSLNRKKNTMFNILHIEKKLGLHFLVLNLAIIQSCFFLKRVNYWVIFTARNRCLIFKTGLLSNPANFQDWRVYAQRNAINYVCSHRSCLQAQHSFLKQRIFIAAKHDPDFILFYVSLFISILDDIMMYTGSLELWHYVLLGILEFGKWCFE